MGLLLEVSILPVLIAAVLGFLISFLWWGKFFGKQWIKYSGLSMAQAKKMQKQSMGGKMLIALIAQIIMAWVLSIMISTVGVVSIFEGVILASYIWLGFVATIGVGIVLWDNKPWALFWINMIGWLVTLVLMAVTLVALG